MWQYKLTNSHHFQIQFSQQNHNHESLPSDFAERTALATTIATWCEHVFRFRNRRIPDIHHPYGPLSKAITTLNTRVMASVHPKVIIIISS